MIASAWCAPYAISSNTSSTLSSSIHQPAAAARRYPGLSAAKNARGAITATSAPADWHMDDSTFSVTASGIDTDAEDKAPHHRVPPSAGSCTLTPYPLVDDSGAVVSASGGWDR